VTGVRFRADTGWEGMCDICRAWLVLDETAEGWHPSTGYRRCAACRALWSRHLNRTGERLTEAQLSVMARAERRRIMRGRPVRPAKVPMSMAERSRRYRARQRAERDAQVAA
jgi:hypothetical protein